MEFIREILWRVAARAVLAVVVICAMGAGRPNVIVVMTDDQGYGDLSAHGNPELKTPNLDRLRGESVRLADFHVAPMCTPTRSQLMTGRDALDNGAMNVSSGRTMMRVGVRTMAEAFRGGGYRTGIFGKWHLGDVYPHRPVDRGFERAAWFASSHIPSAPDWWNNDYFDPHLRVDGGAYRKFEGYCTDVFFEQAMGWMRERIGAGEPFFCYIPTNAPHAPLWVGEKYREPYATKLDAKLASFYGMIANVDENVGRLLAFLEESGAAGNTVVVFLTDNGGTVGVEHFNAGMRGTKVTLWEGGHRVPCFIRAPKELGLGEARDVAGLTQVQDLLPTLGEVCGVEVPGGLDGVSLVPVLKGKGEVPDRMLVVQFSRMDRPRPVKGDAAVLWRRWRLMNKGTELYDLERDPLQERNVAEENREVVATMWGHYERWWAEVEPGLGEFVPVVIGSKRQEEVLLSAADWMDVFLDQQAQVRAGPAGRNGAWCVEAERAGRYRFELRRWPREAGLAIAEGAPKARMADGEMRAGRAIPVKRARLRVGEQVVERELRGGEEAVGFEVELEAGRVEVKSWFLGEGGEELVGAYYVYVTGVR